MGKQRCGSCRYFEDAGIAGSGWCHHPLRRTTSDLILMVRQKELACRDAWSRNLWEPGSFAADADGDSATAGTPLSPLALDEVAGLLDRDAAAQPSIDVAQDVVIGEARLATGATPPWRRTMLEDANGDPSPAALLHSDNKSALKRAREAFRVRQEPAAGELPFNPAVAAAPVPIAQPGERDVPAVQLDAGSEGWEDDSLSGSPDSTEPGVLLNETWRFGVDVEAVEVEEREWLEAIADHAATPPGDREEEIEQEESGRFMAGMPDDDRAVAAASGDGAGWESESEAMVDTRFGFTNGDGLGVEAVPEFDSDREPLPESETGRSGRWTMEYRPKPREVWDLGWSRSLEPEGAGAATARQPKLDTSAGQGGEGMGSVQGHGRRFVARASAGDLYLDREEAPAVGYHDLLPGEGPWATGDAPELIDPESEIRQLAEEWRTNGTVQQAGTAGGETPRRVPGKQGADEGLKRWKPEEIAISQGLPRICRTCRDFRPAEQGSRGWCANQWAFQQRHLVDPDAPAACDSLLGSWWLPADELTIEKVDISAHAEPTPHLDRWLPGRLVAERQRKES